MGELPNLASPAVTGHARLSYPTLLQLPNGDEPPLYSVWRSSYKAMDEFGIGVGLYYRQLLLLSIVRPCVQRPPALGAAVVAMKPVALAVRVCVFTVLRGGAGST